MIENKTSESIDVYPVQNGIGSTEIDANDNADVTIEKDTMITAEGEKSHIVQEESFSDAGAVWIVKW